MPKKLLNKIKGEIQMDFDLDIKEAKTIAELYMAIRRHIRTLKDELAFIELNADSGLADEVYLNEKHY